MSKNLFVVGTGTDVGKTYVTALIVKKLALTANAGYYKAAMSGNLRGDDGGLIPGDAKFVRDISGIKQSLSSMCPFVYENAFSPHLAARIESPFVNIGTVVKCFNELQAQFDYLTIEGSGGIICPIDYDTAGKRPPLFLEDIIKALGVDSVLVADAGLGTINAVVLTVHYMRQKNLKIKGMLFNNYRKGDVMHEDNIAMCQKLTGLDILACVGKGDTEITIGDDILKGLYK